MAPLRMATTEDNADDENDVIQEAKNAKFQNACRIWFCPAEEKIAKELREMPQEQREKVWADLSGNEKTSLFRKDVDENELKLKKCSLEMWQEISKVTHKPALDLAMETFPDYVKSHSFQLMFMRSCEYNGKLAARKLVDHMETRRRLFGDELLGRDVLLSDLNDDDFHTLSTGGIQFLDQKDDAGRAILYFHVENLEFKSKENLSRVLFFALMTALREESVQKLGVVVVWNIMSDFKGGYDYEADRMAIQTVGAVPIRVVARYVIFQSSLWNQVIEVLNYLMNPDLRARSRSIQGDYKEVLYSLLCLGIPSECIPMDANGDLELENLERWIREQQKHERWASEQRKTVQRPRKRSRVCALV